jgi:hypothetical protein
VVLDVRAPLLGCTAFLDMTIRSKDNGLVHQMDDKMHKVLTAEQWPAFEEYKRELRAALTKQ